MSHPLFTLLLAALISTAVVLNGKQTPREKIFHSVWVFLSCITATVAGSWAMYFIHG
jgi:hypothetical protein